MNNPPRTIDLRQYWEALRSRKWSIILPTILFTGLAVLYVVSQTPEYTATARVRVDPLISPFNTQTQINAATPDMATEQETAASTPVAARAKAALGTPLGTDTLLKHLNVQAASSGNILTFQYSSPSAAQAARYTNAFANAYLAYRTGTFTNRVDGLIKQTKQAIARLQSRLVGTPSSQQQGLTTRLSAAQSNLEELQSARQLVQGGAVIDTAQPPHSPASPKVKRDIAVGFVGGLIVGICLALVREGLDDRIKSREELEARLGVPVIGVIPKFDRRSQDGSIAAITDARGPASEAYRMAGATLQHLAAQHGLQVVMIASVLPGGGKTTTTANLGVVLAQAGKRVILVSADLRLPRLHQLFDLQNSSGLSDALLSGRDVRKILQQTAIPNLIVLTSGPEPHNPAAVLASPFTSSVLSSLRGLGADFILLDTPATLSVSDAMILAPLVDGTVLIWNADDSKASTLMQAHELLQTAGGNVVAGIYSFDQSAAGMVGMHRRYQMTNGRGRASNLSLGVPKSGTRGSGTRKTSSRFEPTSWGAAD